MKIYPSPRKIFFLTFLVFSFLKNSLGMGQASLETSSIETSKSIIIQDAWIRPSNTETTASYMHIKNMGSILDQLVAVQTEVCEKVELHRIEKHNGIFRMRPVQAIDIPAGSTTILKPAGMHIMLIGLKKPLVEGQKVELKLVFQNAGNIDLKVDVKMMPKEEKNSPSVEETMTPDTCH